MAASVILLEPSSAGLQLIVKAKTMGFHVIVLTASEGDRTIAQEFLRHADVVERVDTNDDGAVLHTAERLSEHYAVRGILPGFEYYVPTAAMTAACLGLPGLPPEAVMALRHKDLMRAALARSGIRVPEFRLVVHESELHNAAAGVGFPCVVKPTDASGSLNVCKVDNQEDLVQAYRVIADGTVHDMERVFRRDVLVEAYIRGPELSVEGYVVDGTVHFVSITEKVLGAEPHFVEVGHVVAAQISAALCREIQNYVTAVLAALELNMGPFHAELRLAHNGLVLMEIGARLAGDHICDLIHIARGIDLYQIMLACYTGCPVTNGFVSRQGLAGICYFIRPGLGVYTRVTGVQALHTLKGFDAFEILIPPGCPIPEPTSFLGRIGYATFRADHYEALKATLTRADELVHFIV